MLLRGKSLAAARLRTSADASRLLGPGLIDAGLASLATFAVGIYAARELAADALGAYALYFAALFVSGLIPRQLYLLPATISALDSDHASRAALLRRSVPRGLALGLGAAFLTLPAGLPAAGQVERDVLIGLAVTAALVAATSPTQDHTRQVLHFAGLNWWAAGTSGVQLAVVTVALVLSDLAGVPSAWVPLGSLAAGNTLSLGAATLVAHQHAGRAAAPALSFRAALRAGGVLFSSEGVQTLANLAVGWILVVVAGTAALGAAEAARVVAAPILVFSTGLLQVLQPRLMEAGRRGSSSDTRRNASLYLVALGVVGLAYLLVAGWPHRLNGVAALVPRAYDVASLSALRILGFVTYAASQTAVPVLYGAGRYNALFLTNAAGALVSLGVVALLAAPTGAYALPVALITASIVRGALRANLLRSVTRPCPAR